MALTIYAVKHADYADQPRESKFLTSELSRLRQTGVVRFGVEHSLHPTPDPVQNEYWQNVVSHSKKLGLELVPLETGHDLVMTKLHALVMVAAQMRITAGQWDAFVSRMRPKVLSIPDGKTVLSLLEHLPKIVKVTPQNLLELDGAMTFHRSLQLREKALAEKLEHIAIGHSHAADLAATKGLTLVPLGEAVPLNSRRELPFIVRTRLQDHAKWKEKIEALMELAKKTS